MLKGEQDSRTLQKWTEYMADGFNSFPPIDGEDARVQVDALGEPGRRRFRLLAVVEGETHILWMEKQQVQALGLAIDQMLEQLPAASGPGGGESSLPTSFDETTRHQFRVGRLELGFDVRTDRIVISAHDIQAEDEETDPVLSDAQAVSLRITRGEARTLSESAASLVAAGRPHCPMCGSPMDPAGHVCAEQNGHLPFILDDEGFE